MFTDRRCEVITDHPRIRGEHSGGGFDPGPYGGSSPHTRGALPYGRRYLAENGIIPAYAGSTTAMASPWDL